MRTILMRIVKIFLALLIIGICAWLISGLVNGADKVYSKVKDFFSRNQTLLYILLAIMVLCILGALFN